MPVYGLNCFSLMKHDTVVFSKRSVEILEDRIMKQMKRAESLQKPYKYIDYKPIILGESEHEEHPIFPPIV